MSKISDAKEQGAGRRCALLAASIIALVIIADQALKIYVKTHFYMGEDVEVLPWFHLKFIENNGMAFGLELWNKYVLTFGRILAVAFFIWIIARLCSRCTMRKGFVVALALITAGAAGNIFDCVLYGELFSNPYPPMVAEFLPAGGGYAGWFEGRVVDMLYFPFFTITWPDWIPVIGGSQFEFFQYIFNIADSAICVGVFMLILFYSRDVSEAWCAVKTGNDKTGNDKK